MSAVSYYFSKVLVLGFDAAVAAVSQKLKDEGFGIITEIDVTKTLKTKIGVEFRPYRILGACNPALAHEALKLEDKVGTKCTQSCGEKIVGTGPTITSCAVGREAVGDYVASDPPTSPLQRGRCPIADILRGEGPGTCTKTRYRPTSQLL